MLTTTTRNEVMAVTGTMALLAGLLLFLLAGLASPVQALDAPANPANECGDLNFLVKFEWDSGGSGSFEGEGGATDTDGSADGYSYASATGVTVSYTVDGDNEAFTVDWTSPVTPVDLVVTKNGQNSNGSVYDEGVSGSETVSTNALSHVTFCYDDPEPQEPTVEVGGECDEAFVEITDPEQVGIEVDVFINGELVETITASKDYTLGPDQELEATDGGSTSYGTFAWQDCSEPEAPQYSATPGCVQGTSQVVVTISDPDGVGGSVDIVVDGVVVATTDEGGTYLGEAGQTLQVVTSTTALASLSLERAAVDVQELEPQVLAEAVFKDCFVPEPEPEPDPTTATFDVGSQCAENIPVIDYKVDVTEGDDPVGTITLVVTQADGTVLVEQEVGGDANGRLEAPGREGAAVTVTWDFDDTAQSLTLAEDCGEVLGVVEENEPEPAPKPETEVKGEVVASEQLPNTGATTDALLVLGGGLLALGCGLLLTERRMRYVRI